MSSITRKLAAFGCAVMTLFSMSTTAMAATNTVTEDSAKIVKTVVKTDNGTMTEGRIKPYALAYGPLYQYPAEGGTWEYGFWNAKVRSYYTVDRPHGSTVVLNGKVSRSVDTAAGKKSIAELWAIQTPDGVDEYYYRVCD